MANDLFQNYIKGIYKLIERDDTREESFYDTLKDLMEAYGQNLKKETAVTVLPKKSEAGNPDLRVWDGESLITGYIEAKHPSKRNLEYIENSEQLKRYREAYPNLILTNFLEFRLYKGGEYWKEVNIGSSQLAKISPEQGVVLHKEKFQELLNLFFDFTQPRIRTPRVLAEMLSKKAKIMRDYIVLPSLEEKEPYFSTLYNSFKNHLLKDLTPQTFADLFAQTFTYGLFIAKYQFETEGTLFGKKISSLPFTTKTAYDFIQKSFGILREIFRTISTEDLPKNLEVIVDDIIDILNHTDIYKLLTHYNEGKRKDPIYHLYETFLFNYDPERKKKLGIYYTPLEVVSFIVNSVNSILKDKKLFQAQDGLATYKTDSLENSVTLLDPAVGTGTFFVEATEKAIEEVKSKYSKSKDFITQFIRNHILKHFFAFEILIAPYVVSHLKTLFNLSREGFEFTEKEKLKIFLTNTLEFPKDKKEEQKILGTLFEQKLLEEQVNALEVKKQTPILIIIGNPPYSVSSQNKVDTETEFGKFYESYKENVLKEEKNIKPLSDDYIKFLAFAHWKINQTGKGIIGMITNNSYLDGIIHRDMRKKLYDDFDLIYILNLHGSARKEITKNGKKDENVFDIMQGVTINIFVKPQEKTKKQIFYQELIGQREDKYKFLDNHNTSDVAWIKLEPKEPYWFFVPKEFKEKKWENCYSVKDVFNKYTSGVTTSRDNFVIGRSKNELIKKIYSFINSDLPLDLLKGGFQLKDTKKWKTKTAQEALKQKGVDENIIYQYAYRPFDKRWIYYDDILIERSRKPLMKNMLQQNVGLILMREIYSNNFNHSFITSDITDRNFFKQGQIVYIFPLWLYNSDTKTQNQLPVSIQPEPKTSNIKKEIIDLLSSSYKTLVSPEEIFYYIYAVLYSNIYRQKYLEFLKIDFPRIPFTKDYKLFKQLSEIGKRLIDIHLLKSHLLNDTSSRFEGNNSGLVKKVSYNSKEKRVYINEKQYFTNVELETWNYFIGGYQVLNKWIKDRKGKYLTDEEIKTYIKIVETLRQTIEIQKEIDEIYLKVEGNLIKISNEN